MICVPGTTMKLKAGTPQGKALSSCMSTSMPVGSILQYKLLPEAKELPSHTMTPLDATPQN